MDCIGMIRRSSHFLESALRKLHVGTAGVTLFGWTITSMADLAPLSIEQLTHLFHIFSAWGIAANCGLLGLAKLLRKISRNEDKGNRNNMR